MPETITLTLAQAYAREEPAPGLQSQNAVIGSVNELSDPAYAIKTAEAATEPVVIYVETDPLVGPPASESWWDVPVGAVSTLESTTTARELYEHKKAEQLINFTPTA